MTQDPQTQSQTAQQREPEGELQSVNIPDSALVHCPEVAFKLAAVSKCPSCPHFAGLADRFPGGPQPFAVRYAVSCLARPTLREVKELA